MKKRAWMLAVVLGIGAVAFAAARRAPVVVEFPEMEPGQVAIERVCYAADAVYVARSYEGEITLEVERLGCQPVTRIPPTSESCGYRGGDFCAASGACPMGFRDLGPTWDCPVCCTSR